MGKGNTECSAVLLTECTEAVYKHVRANGAPISPTTLVPLPPPPFTAGRWPSLVASWRTSRHQRQRQQFLEPFALTTAPQLRQRARYHE